ncbi:hypothetical protein ACQBAU_12795 [Propionibacteriaceae bacterium Y2011]|uniref:hypothetical protein n=1 Tax=Microlunatus sp. Y2014 TaxID=3418488 RepID=UPI003B491555
MTIGHAIALSVIAALAFAVAAVLQHEAVGHQMEDHGNGRGGSGDSHDDRRQRRHLGLAFFRDLLRRPRWLIGFSMSGLGALLHLAALRGAPVAVVQPIAVLSVPLAVLIGMWRSHRRPNGAVWGGVAAAMAGVSIFVWLAARNTASELPATSHIIIAGLAIAALITVLVLLGQRGPDWVHSLAWTGGAASAYGLAAGYMKTIFVQLDHGVPLSAPTIWLPGIVLLLTYPAAAYMLQHAFVSGSPAVVVGGLTVTDPMLAVLLGAFLLGETSQLTPVVTMGMVGCAVVAVLGVGMLSRYHPDVVRVTEEHDEVADPHEAVVAGRPALTQHGPDTPAYGDTPYGADLNDDPGSRPGVAEHQREDER